MTNIDQLPYVEAELNYLAPMTERPRYYAYEPEPGEPRSNLTPEPHRMQIHDAAPDRRRARSRHPGLRARRAAQRGARFLGR